MKTIIVRYHIKKKKKRAAEKLIRNCMEMERIVQHSDVYNARAENQKRNCELGL